MNTVTVVHIQQSERKKGKTEEITKKERKEERKKERKKNLEEGKTNYR